MRTVLALMAAALSAAPAFAQGHAHGTGAQSPYAGMAGREIKALSEDEVVDLRAGRGMSFALPAELNGYPGPRHVLDLAEPLGLTAEQHARTEALFGRMQREAAALGERLLAAERALDALFSERAATPETVSGATAEAASLEGELRATHLRYHLEMMAVLTPGQVARYRHLRGYGGDGG